MFDNVQKIIVCHFNAEIGCVDSVMTEDKNRKIYTTKYVVIYRFLIADSFRFSVKDSRVNIYIEWVHPKSKEIYTTRLRLFDGILYNYRNLFFKY